MRKIVLKEGTLNDDELFIVEEGYKFKGGYIAIIEQYEYASVWHNNRIVRRFKSFKTLNAFLEKNYKDFELELN